MPAKEVAQIGDLSRNSAFIRLFVWVKLYKDYKIISEVQTAENPCEYPAPDIPAVIEQRLSLMHIVQLRYKYRNQREYKGCQDDRHPPSPSGRAGKDIWN